MPQTPPNAKRRLLAALVIFGVPALIGLIVLFLLTRKHEQKAGGSSPAGAFNTKMPAPNLKTSEKNKLEIYLQAEQDSMKRQQQLRSDPYARPSGPAALPATSLPNAAAPISRGVSSFPSALPRVDTNEQKVNEHLAKLYAALHSSPATNESLPNASGFPVPGAMGDREVDRLERLANNLHSQDTATSPQLRQINALLDKVIAIQHPGQGTPPASSRADSSSALPVSALHDDPANIAETNADAGSGANAFYGLTTDEEAAVPASAAIRAVVHADQTVQTGSVVKLRLLQDIYVKGIRIPANSFVFGPCEVSNERVVVNLSKIQYDGQVYPISMKVLDGADGLEGLYVPGAITRDVIKESAGQSVGGIGLTTLDPSLGAQAAAAGIETAKNLFNRKLRLITATLKAGHVAILEPGQTLR